MEVRRIPLRATWPVLGATLGVMLGSSAISCQSGEDCVPGAEGCACLDDACVGDLVCRSNACVDASGGSGGEVTDSGSDGGAPLDCTTNTPLVISGALKTNVANIMFDRASAEVTHKRDVDEFEDGCVNFIRFTLGSGDGCEMLVEAHTTLTPQARLDIKTLELRADSQCPDFPDTAEGNYVISPTGLVIDGSGVAGEQMVPDRNVANSCIVGDYRLFITGTLAGDNGEELLVSPTELVISGAFPSVAVDLACPTF